MGQIISEKDFGNINHTGLLKPFVFCSAGELICENAIPLNLSLI